MFKLYDLFEPRTYVLESYDAITGLQEWLREAQHAHRFGKRPAYVAMMGRWARSAK